jgi:hypothetical protein
MTLRHYQLSYYIYKSPSNIGNNSNTFNQQETSDTAEIVETGFDWSDTFVSRASGN